MYMHCMYVQYMHQYMYVHCMHVCAVYVSVQVCTLYVCMYVQYMYQYRYGHCMYVMDQLHPIPAVLSQSLLGHLRSGLGLGVVIGWE